MELVAPGLTLVLGFLAVWVAIRPPERDARNPERRHGAAAVGLPSSQMIPNDPKSATH
jgi:hypothetical protein